MHFCLNPLRKWTLISVISIIIIYSTVRKLKVLYLVVEEKKLSTYEFIGVTVASVSDPYAAVMGGVGIVSQGL